MFADVRGVATLTSDATLLPLAFTARIFTYRVLLNANLGDAVDPAPEPGMSVQLVEVSASAKLDPVAY
ncbi:hypothetical protein [Candidatus Poriferisodalis sp.]|uniref:hypothetical protein n=1 Tax=Candidatus Poriferisodalis sp. TaxID=3101277 RepID=UPI003B015C74